jgi:hypothetical protein
MSNPPGMHPKWMFIVVGIVVLLGALVAWWVHEADVMPVVRIPASKMPSPNAYDFYVKAYNATVDRSEVNQDYLEVAYKAKRPAGLGSLVGRNKHALRILRQGFALPYLEPAQGYSGSVDAYGEFRFIAGLLVIESANYEFEGGFGAAMESSLDAIRLGSDIPRSGGVDAFLSGKLSQNLGQHQAFPIVEHLNSSEARQSARRLEEIMARSVPYSDILRQDRLDRQSELMQMFQSTEWREGAKYILFVNEYNVRAKVWLYLANKRRIMSEYERVMDAAIAASKRPYSSRKTVSPGYLSEGLLPLYEGLRYHFTNCQTKNAMLLLALALQAYRLDHGRYPDTLAQLTPHYLKAVPNDPFAANQPMRYRRQGGKYLLYSIGPDGTDDGGKPATDPRANPTEARYYKVRMDSKGDIVAGVNVR